MEVPQLLPVTLRVQLCVSVRLTVVQVPLEHVRSVAVRDCVPVRSQELENPPQLPQEP